MGHRPTGGRQLFDCGAKIMPLLILLSGLQTLVVLCKFS